MNPPDAKVRREHLVRKAFVYVRQSSLIQVQNHQESTRRQYALQQRAHSLGWTEAHIEIIDEDLGQSASKVGVQRIGFQRLLVAMVNGEVGAIFSLEVSRLARQDSEGHRLVELAALMGVLLIDEQQVYDPDLPDDRLMLGLKVLLSSNEVRLMRQRLQENKLRKAQRGDLRLQLPIGLVDGEQGGILIDPDEQVQGAVRLVFDRFRLGGSLSSVVSYFNSNGLMFPRRKGNWNGPLEWGRLTMQRTQHILSNPLYAGAYVYARTALKTVLGEDGRIKRKAHTLGPEEWGAVLWDAFEGYISRAEFEANRARLAENTKKTRRCNVRKDGAALLSGIILCGHCGKRMYVRYSGKTGRCISYLCNTARARYAEPVCQTVPGARIDQLVAERLLSALTPAQIELSLAALQELERQQAALSQQRQRCLEGARYAARLAQRRYEQVDPDNRLVARTLEARWEACLKEVDRLESESALVSQQHSVSLSKQQRQALLNLVQDLPALWNAASTSWKQRKQLLELLVADVTLTRQDNLVTVHIRWHTNQVETGHVTVQGKAPRTADEVVQRITELYQTHKDEQVARILHQEGLSSACGKTFTCGIVAKIRRRNGLKRQPLAPLRTPPAVIQRIRELSPIQTDKETARILNLERFTSASGKPFTKSIVADIRRYYEISKHASVGTQ